MADGEMSVWYGWIPTVSATASKKPLKLTTGKFGDCEIHQEGDGTYRADCQIGGRDVAIAMTVENGFLRFEVPLRDYEEEVSGTVNGLYAKMNGHLRVRIIDGTDNGLKAIQTDSVNEAIQSVAERLVESHEICWRATKTADDSDRESAETMLRGFLEYGRAFLERYGDALEYANLDECLTSASRFIKAGYETGINNSSNEQTCRGKWTAKLHINPDDFVTVVFLALSMFTILAFVWTFPYEYPDLTPTETAKVYAGIVIPFLAIVLAYLYWKCRQNSNMA